METLFTFDLPTDPTKLATLQTTIQWTGAVPIDSPAVKGYTLSEHKGSDIDALRGELIACGVTFTEQQIDVAELLFGAAACVAVGGAS
jgi:hypothetical protein